MRAEGEPPITGEATVTIEVANPQDSARMLDVEATIDTGFSGHLSLTSEILRDVGLVPLATRRAVLATGEVRRVSTFAASVLWNGEGRIVPVYRLEGKPLLGMAMLWGSKLTVDLSVGGEVLIE